MRNKRELGKNVRQTHEQETCLTIMPTRQEGPEGKEKYTKKEEEDRQYNYKISMRTFLITIFATEKQYFFSILIRCLHSYLNYPECEAHAPYCIVLCDLSCCAVLYTLP
jgi:hypothetical protein